MNRQTRILGISGSLRRESYNSAALRATAGLAPEGAAVEMFELDGIPLFNQDEEKNPPAKVVELKRRVRESARSRSRPEAGLAITAQVLHGNDGLRESSTGEGEG